MSNNNKVALVTGGNRGIGYELVRLLASNGYKVILTSRDPVAGNKAAQQLRDSTMDVTFVQMDLDRQESIRQAVATVINQFEKLDVLINNAGVYLDDAGTLLSMDASILKHTMSTNFFGAYDVIRSFIPVMERHGYGRIINVSSEYGAISEMTYQSAGAYKLSKLALNGMSRLIAAEIKGDIKINAVDPGWVSSDMGGPSAPRTPKQAAESILWLAAIGPEGPNGGFFRDGKQIEW